MTGTPRVSDARSLTSYAVTGIVAALGGYYLGLRNSRSRNNLISRDVRETGSREQASPSASCTTTPVRLTGFSPGADEVDILAQVQNEKRVLIIVAAKLPIHISKRKDGTWEITWDDGRSFLSNMRKLQDRMTIKWVGWPGIDVPKSEQDDLEAALEEHGCIPVFLLPDLRHRFYGGFCKTVLWPLLHYNLPGYHAEGFGKTWSSGWQAYTAANMLYANVVARVCETPNATLWVHNYHLLLVPSFLRKKLPRAKIGK